MDKKTLTYIAIGFGVLTLILIILASILYFSGGSPAPVVGVALVTAAGIAAAEKTRRSSKDQVAEAKKEGETTSEKIEEVKEMVEVEVEKAKEEVTEASPEEKAKMGEDLFGPKS